METPEIKIIGLLAKAFGNKLLYSSLIYTIISYLSCSPTESSKSWNAPFPAIGSLSSPRGTDLNKDGVMDIVIGAGLNEYIKTEQGVLALDGKSGKVLWQVSSTDQIVGSPTFVDINSDHIDDVVIGGRSHNLIAINGKNGKVLWRYQVQNNDNELKRYARFNFFNCQLVDDANNDKIPDILAACAGNTVAQPNSLKDRSPGTLMIIDSKTGSIISIDTMPDGRENYCSPVLQSINNQNYIIYGTGGETFGGHLYKVPIFDLLKNDLSKSKILCSNKLQGFIAPLTLVDLNNDGIDEIIVSAHNGEITCFDGISDTLIWQISTGLEANNMLAPGYFNNDSVYDFFGFFAKGNWPNNEGIVEFVLDGVNGKIIFSDTVGNIGFSSPISFQADNDKYHEVLLHINYGKPTIMGYTSNTSQLLLYDFPGFKKIALDTLISFKNCSTTPMIGDLDKNGELDIITAFLSNTFKMDEVNGMFISRIPTKWQAQKILWGGYMGTNGTGHIDF